ncbi:TonB-dependent receptor plug domain-containing protein [Sporocytophaga myxococcoides]|uniref:TonB-dependent receptor plug domain-containing protein n=1 Tax=Sporocytophaga myxococcoides TaxID=153721 RepID=UPI0006933D34|nr:TonB-dependent receptor plug domain-containing protein [Sporocytophaga myxococcoides]
MRIWIYLLFLLVLPKWAAGQQVNTGVLSGAVMDEEGAPANFAIVRIAELNLVTPCDSLGKYKFENIPYNGYTLIIQLFEGPEKKVPVKVDRPDVSVDVILDSGSEKKALDEVVVEGKSQKRVLEEQGYAVNVIETKTVEMQSIQANELLDRSAGVRIRQQGGLGSNIQYNINGLSGNSVKIFIDGIPISSYGPSFSLNSIPTSMIERIEVFKGVVPSQLSDDALGGAVNVILKSSIKNMLTASYSYGSFNTHQFNLNGGYRNSKNGLTVRASGFYNYSDNSYKVWGEKVYITNSATGKIQRVTAKRFHDAYKSYGGKFDIGFTNVKWADQFLFGVVISDMAKEVQHGATMETVYGNRNTKQNTQLYSLTYAKQDFLTKGLKVNFFSSYSKLNRAVIDTVPYIYNWFGQLIDANNDGKWDRWSSGAEGSNPTLQKSLEHNITGRLNVSYDLSKQHRLNLNYMLSHFSRDIDDPRLTQVERDLMDTRYMTKHVISGAYETNLFKERLKTSLFAKQYTQNVRLKDAVRESRTGIYIPYEHSKTTPVLGYGLAASFTVFPKIMLTGSVEQAVRLPEGTEVFGNSAENIDASYELKPERSQNVNFGLNLGNFKLKNHNLAFVSNFFYRNTTDMIRQAVPTQVSETYRFENLLSVSSKGADIELLYNYKQRLFFAGNVSMFNARFNTEFDGNGQRYYYYGKRLRNAPYFTANNNVRLSLPNIIQKEALVSMYYNFGYVHEFLRDWEGIGVNNLPVIPTQLIHDLGVAYTLPNKKLTFSLDAKNILDHQVFDNWALQKPGRAFYAKVTYKII